MQSMENITLDGKEQQMKKALYFFPELNRARILQTIILFY